MTTRFRSFLFTLLLAVLIALAVLGVLRQANPLFNFPSLDNGYYLYLGQQVMAGKVAYIDVWEYKPPGIFYINALGLWLGHGSRWGVWGLEFVALLTAAWFGYLLLEKMLGVWPAIIGTLTWLWALDPVLQGGNLTEEYALPFSFLAAWAFYHSLQQPDRRLPPFLVGLGFAGAFLLRPNNAGAQFVMVVVWALGAVFQRNPRQLAWRLFWSGLAVAFSLGIVSLYFLWQGNFYEMFHASILYALSVSSQPDPYLSTLFSGLTRIGAPAGLMAAGYLLQLSLQWQARSFDPWRSFLLLALPLEAFLSSLSGLGYDHYFIPWLLALGLLTGPVVATITPAFSRFFEKQRMVALLLTIGLFLALSFALAPHVYAEYRQAAQRLVFERARGIEIDHPVADYIRQKTAPQDRVLVWGTRVVFNYLSRREAVSRYLFYPLVLDIPYGRSMAEQFYLDLVTQRPALIIDAARINQDLVPALDPAIRQDQFKSGKLWATLPENLDQVLAYIDENYQLVDTIDGYPIYHRK